MKREIPKATVVQGPDDGDYDIHIGEPDMINFTSMVAWSQTENGANAMALAFNEWIERNWPEEKE